jgi:hypothetical protein
VTRCGLAATEAVENFEFGKNNRGYWDGADLLKQVREEALPITEALYPGYSLLFLFDNAISHCVCAPDALQVKNMAKGPGGKQSFLRDGWFEKDGVCYQPISRKYLRKRMVFDARKEFGVFCWNEDFGPSQD